MAEGKSFESFAAMVSSHRDTLYQWTRTHADFAEAKKMATDLCLLWWEERGLSAVTGKVPMFNAAMWIYNMKVRFKWIEPKDIQDEEICQQRRTYEEAMRALEEEECAKYPRRD
jgi:hypothetical protein